MKIICLKWGDKFSHEHVNRLYKMVCKNYKNDFGFYLNSKEVFAIKHHTKKNYLSL